MVFLVLWLQTLEPQVESKTPPPLAGCLAGNWNFACEETDAENCKIRQLDLISNNGKNGATEDYLNEKRCHVATAWVLKWEMPKNQSKTQDLDWIWNARVKIRNQG